MLCACVLWGIRWNILTDHGNRTRKPENIQFQKEYVQIKNISRKIRHFYPEKEGNKTGLAVNYLPVMC